MTPPSSRLVLGKKSLGRRLLGLILPVSCLVCGHEGEWLCPDCLSDLDWTRSDLCHLCGKFGTDGLCQRCRRSTRLDGLISPFAYRQLGVQRLIKQAKYQGYYDIYRWLAPAIRRRVLRSLPPDGNWIFCPIPLSKKRQIERGFNQAEVIARGLAGDDFGAENLLSRTRHTSSQTSLKRDKRSGNVEGCFALSRQSKARAGSLPVPDAAILVDDVVTTGSTLREAAKVLRKAGAKEIWAITIAHG